mgnify:FL=1
MKHRMKLTLEQRDGVLQKLVCVDHEPAGCGYVETFDWDQVAAMESYVGPVVELAEFDVDFTVIDSEIGIEEWQIPRVDETHESGAES